jgi:hypothetical protein
MSSTLFIISEFVRATGEHLRWEVSSQLATMKKLAFK